MSDSCETVKMIRYKIAFIMKDREAVLFEEQVVVSDKIWDCDGTSFEVWKTAAFVQDLHANPRPIPSSWMNKNGDPEYPPAKYRTFPPGKGPTKKEQEDFEKQIKAYDKEETKASETEKWDARWNREKTYYTGLPDDDKKYLRFYQEEEATYDRDKDTQVDVLKDIQQQLRDGVKVVK